MESLLGIFRFTILVGIGRGLPLHRGDVGVFVHLDGVGLLGLEIDDGFPVLAYHLDNLMHGIGLHRTVGHLYLYILGLLGKADAAEGQET